MRSGKLGQVTTNPQKFMDLAHEAIEQALMEELATGITYEKIGGEGPDSVYAMSLLEEQELTTYLTSLVTDVGSSAYEDVIVDSDIATRWASTSVGSRTRRISSSFVVRTAGGALGEGLLHRAFIARPSSSGGVHRRPGTCADLPCSSVVVRRCRAAAHS